MSQSDRFYMELAIEQALKGLGGTPPNPLVGSLIRLGDEVVSSGYHQSAGEAHAEINALRNLPHPVSDEMVLYVTLEPCSTHGRTGACTTAIIDSGIKKVVIGAIDPNPLHQGNGIKILRDAGIDVLTSVCEDACREMNVIFNHSISHDSMIGVAWVATDLRGSLTNSSNSPWLKHLVASEKNGHIDLYREYHQLNEAFKEGRVDYLFWETTVVESISVVNPLSFQKIDYLQDALELTNVYHEPNEKTVLVRGWVKK